LTGGSRLRGGQNQRGQNKNGTEDSLHWGSPS
jgi:hypothetical protein